MSCAKCKDDYVWATNFGGCKSYNTDGPNHAFCAEDGADVACPASCGTCTCPGAGEEEETDLTVFYVLGAIAISIFCIPVLVMWVRRGHAHVKERKRGVLSKFRNYRATSGEARERHLYKTIRTFGLKLTTKLHRQRSDRDDKAIGGNQVAPEPEGIGRPADGDGDIALGGEGSGLSVEDGRRIRTAHDVEMGGGDEQSVTDDEQPITAPGSQPSGRMGRLWKKLVGGREASNRFAAAGDAAAAAAAVGPVDLEDRLPFSRDAAAAAQSEREQDGGQDGGEWEQAQRIQTEHELLVDAEAGGGETADQPSYPTVKQFNRRPSDGPPTPRAALPSRSTLPPLMPSSGSPGASDRGGGMDLHLARLQLKTGAGAAGAGRSPANAGARGGGGGGAGGGEGAR